MGAAATLGTKTTCLEVIQSLKRQIATRVLVFLYLLYPCQFIHIIPVVLTDFVQLIPTEDHWFTVSTLISLHVRSVASSLITPSWNVWRLLYSAVETSIKVHFQLENSSFTETSQQPKVHLWALSNALSCIRVRHSFSECRAATIQFIFCFHASSLIDTVIIFWFCTDRYKKQDIRRFLWAFGNRDGQISQFSDIFQAKREHTRQMDCVLPRGIF